MTQLLIDKTKALIARLENMSVHESHYGDVREWLKQHEEEAVTHAAVIQRARDEYTTDSNCDIEIDDTPALSIAEEGVWVQAWVWVDTQDSDN